MRESREVSTTTAFRADGCSCSGWQLFREGDGRVRDGAPARRSVFTVEHPAHSGGPELELAGDPVWNGWLNLRGLSCLSLAVR